MHDGSFVSIRDETSAVVVQGVPFEAQVEDGRLRLTRAQATSNLAARHRELVLDMDNELKHRRQDAKVVDKEIYDIVEEMKMGSEAAVSELTARFLEQTAVRRSHTARIKELEETEDVCVDYQEQTDKWSVELAVGSMVHLDVVAHPVVWCTWSSGVCCGVAASQVQEGMQVIPMSATFAAFTTASGAGVVRSRVGVESQFVLTSRDCRGELRESGGEGELWVVEAEGGEVKASVTDGGDGTYEVLYRVLSVFPDRKLSLSVCLGREPISGSPFAVRVSRECEGKFAFKFGSEGNGNREFKTLTFLAVDDTCMYVADYDNHRVQVLKKDSSLMTAMIC